MFVEFLVGPIGLRFWSDWNERSWPIVARSHEQATRQAAILYGGRPEDYLARLGRILENGQRMIIIPDEYR